MDSRLLVEESELRFDFRRASGPGGQNVNKVATAVQLRFDVLQSPTLPENVRQRLMQLAKNRITEQGILIIDARRFRTQEQNRQDAIERLTELIRRASEAPKPRKKSRPTQASRIRRLESKRRRGDIKRLRSWMPD
jgi:ribosome-associated protein